MLGVGAVSRFVRPTAVEVLAAAYRHKGRSAYADRVIAHRHEDFSIAECRAALAIVRVELESELIVTQVLRDLADE